MKYIYEVTNYTGEHGAKVSFGKVEATSEEDAIDIIHTRQVLTQDAGWPKSCLRAQKLGTKE